MKDRAPSSGSSCFEPFCITVFDSYDKQCTICWISSIKDRRCKARSDTHVPKPLAPIRDGDHA